MQEYDKLLHDLSDLQRADVNRRRLGLERLPVSSLHHDQLECAVLVFNPLTAKLLFFRISP